MRKLLFLAFLATSLFLTNCKKDEADSSDPIVGKWKLDNIYLKNGKNTVYDGTETLTFRIEMQGKDLNTIVDLKADGTYASSGTYTASYKFYDGLDLFLEQDIPVAPFSATGTYTRTGNIFKSTDSSGQTSEGTIVAETSDSMTIEVALNLSQNQGGVISTNTGTLVQVLKRQ
jgi:hypothetical protein